MNAFNVLKLEREKTARKGVYTKAKNRLFSVIDSGRGSNTQAADKLEELSAAFDNLQKVCDELFDHYERAPDADGASKVLSDLQKQGEDFEQSSQRAREYLASQADASGSISEHSYDSMIQPLIEDQLSRGQLERLTDIQQLWGDATRPGITQDQNLSCVQSFRPLSPWLPARPQAHLEGAAGPISAVHGVIASTPSDPLQRADEIKRAVAFKQQAGEVEREVQNKRAQVERVYFEEESTPPVEQLEKSQTTRKQLVGDEMRPGMTKVQSLPQVVPSFRPLSPWVPGRPQTPHEVTADHIPLFRGPIASTPPDQKWPDPPLLVPVDQINQISDSNEQGPQRASLMEGYYEPSRHLKPVSLHKFSGDKRRYEAWHAAFVQCVDKSRYLTDVDKMLRLLEYCEGEALRTIEKLGCSPSAYKSAMKRLELKYGGEQRQLILRLEDLDRFKQVRDGKPRELEQFAELVDVVIVKLRDSGNEADLRKGAFYIQLLRKMDTTLVAKYKRWVREKGLPERVESLLEYVNEEARDLIEAEETSKGMAREQQNTNPRENRQRTFAIQEAKPEKGVNRNCVLCDQCHGPWACDRFKDMSADQRWEVAKHHKLCFRCLGSGHQGETCRRSRMCGIQNCKSQHHRLLHSGRRVTRPEEFDRSVNKDQLTTGTSPSEKMSKRIQKGPSTEGESPAKNHTMVASTSRTLIGLRTAPVYISNGSTRLKVYALFDAQSTRTYLEEDVSDELGLVKIPHESSVKVFQNREITFQSADVEFTIESLDGKIKQIMSAETSQGIVGDLEVVDWNRYRSRWKHLAGIPFPRVEANAKVDLLIGADYIDLICSEEDVRGQGGEPIGRLTPLGWTCVGKIEDVGGRSKTHRTCFINTQPDLDSLVRRFWELEEPKEATVMRPEEKAAMESVTGSLSWGGENYCVGLPWKDKTPLPNNYKVALKRLQSTEKKLTKDPIVGEAYRKVLDQYQEKGYIRKVPGEERLPTEVWYLPHFPVLRPDKKTTKTRIVFDASAKCGDVCLNDKLHHGPKLQNELFAVLLRFRRESVAVICDVAEMYLQIKLAPEDRPYHRFLWRDLDDHRAPDVYEFTRVVFGVNASPFMAQFVTQEHARRHEDQYPRAAEAVLKSTYMDDTMDSLPDVKTGIDLYRQLSTMLEAAGMHARKWLSNEAELLRQVPAGDCASEVDLDLGELPHVKTLGVLWSPSEDVFKFQANIPEMSCCQTKRGFLKKIATLFDPLGFLAPYVIRAKILFQDMWTSGADWDDLLARALSANAHQWFQELEDLQSLQIPRCLRITGVVQKISLHIFVDASQEAYGAVGYTRYEYEDGTVSCRLVAAKARVTPLKAISIPRLELMAAVVGLRLAIAIGSTLQLNKNDWTFWSDSSDTLFWIRGRSRNFKPFVANRVGEIQSETNPDQWRFVPGTVNPADMLTRGRAVKTLISEDSWWAGPEYLRGEPQSWPMNKIDEPTELDPEIKKRFCSDVKNRVLLTVSWSEADRLHPNRFSSWKRLTRVLARVMRFVENCQLPPQLRRKGPIDSEDIHAAEVRLIRVAQEESFTDELQALTAERELPTGSRLSPLKPKLDEDGLIRCDGRLQYAEWLPWETRFPIILPRNHRITKLIVKDYHEEAQHGGTNQVLALLSSRFWIMASREAIREWERECMKCRRDKVRATTQVMAPLPECRLKKSMRAFSQASVDFAGPFLTKQGRGKIRTKRYLCLFTCLATRAVHLEVAYCLDTDAFLDAFYRMAWRRGMPEEMVSDNGTNFVGAQKELEAAANIDADRVQEATACKKVKWHFNPPLAPHFSGVHEVMIKAAKKAINAILGNADVTDSELVSAVIAAEGLINSRPLTYQTSNPADLVPLTPNHFLMGQMGGQFAASCDESTAVHPRRRWRRVQELAKHFWHRWIAEWIPGLNPRKKWFKDHDNLKAGDVVVVMSSDTPRGRWPLGRIVEVFPGKDKKVRVATVQVGRTVVKRPVVKLCRLESSVDD